MRATAVFAALVLGACQSHPPLALASRVDIPRFMGRWYVIAAIPTRIEREAWGATETYSLAPDGTVPTVFSFSQGSLEGPVHRYTPTGFPREDGNGAVWGMQFIWPFKADYRVMYVDENYTQTVIGRQKRDYAWIMARTAHISTADYDRLRALLESQGYNLAKLRKVPQPPDP